MAKILDLDDLAKTDPEIVLKLAGKSHVMKPLSVGDFINNTKRLDKLAETPVSEQFEIFLDIVDAAFPTVGKDVLAAMSMNQLEQIMDFVQTAQKEADEDAAEQGSVEGNAPKAKSKA